MAIDFDRRAAIRKMLGCKYTELIVVWDSETTTFVPNPLQFHHFIQAAKSQITVN